MEVSIKKKLHMEVDLPDLPSHIISFEILTRLPAKSLMRFKCVCKFWSSSLFRDPLFVKAHQKRYNQNNKTTHLSHSSRLLSIQVNPELGFTKIPSPANILTRKPMKSSNGLICLISEDAGPVLIINSCTRESTTLPASQFQLGRHPSHTYQIGFSPLTNEYKILHVHSYPSKTSPRMRFMFEIFTLGSTSKSWRHVPAICFDDLDVKRRGIGFYRTHTLCINGALHWGASNKKGQHTILAFDLGEESFRVIPLPQDYRTLTFTDLIEVNGCVAIFGSSCLGPQMMDLWILKDYQNQVWVKESIEFPDDWEKLGKPVPACTLNTGELLLFPRLSGGEVHVYDIKSKSYQRTKIVLPNGSLASYDENVVPLS